MSNDITVELSKPIKFTPDNSGDLHDGSFVVLREPTSQQKELEICAFFKQEFFRAAKSFSQENKEEKDKPEPDKNTSVDMTANDMLSWLYSSSITNMPEILNKSKELFCIVGKIEDKKTLNKILINRICPEDLEKMLGEYLINFTLRSVLSNL